MQLNPHLSVVCTSRNDNHGQSLNYRTQIFLNCLAIQCNKFKIYSELLFIEWNPPRNKNKLLNELIWPKSEYLSIKIIEVEDAIHNKYSHSKKIGLYQMIAKNVGVRRASGKFILSTNIDIIFSDEVFKFIKYKLDKDIIYTAIRYDIPNVFPDIPDEEKILYGFKHFFRVHLSQASLAIEGHAIPKIRVLGDLYFKYLLFHHNLERFRGYFKRYKDSKFLFNFFNLNILIRLFGLLMLFKVTLESFYLKYDHTNACGDFTLCSKEIWSTLRGYPEWDMQSFHLDSLFIHQGKNYGFNNQIIKGPIFHIEHSPGSGFTPEYEEILFNRFKENNIPYLSNDEFKEHLDFQRINGKVIYNDKSWGFSNENLTETII